MFFVAGCIYVYMDKSMYMSLFMSLTVSMFCSCPCPCSNLNCLFLFYLTMDNFQHLHCHIRRQGFHSKRLAVFFPRKSKENFKVTFLANRQLSALFNPRECHQHVSFSAYYCPYSGKSLKITCRALHIAMVRH
jgi:hypothetical protein